MSFDLFRNVDVENLADIYRHWDTNKDKAPKLGSLRSGQRVDLQPGSERRRTSTVQSALIEMTDGSRWAYTR